jgi:Ulp1 family protease
MHWVCAVAFMQEKTIRFYDSMGSAGLEDMKCIFRYIKDEHMDKKKSPLPDADSWKLIPVGDCPRQRNGKLSTLMRLL